jgi:hypothetical protein
VRGSLRSRNVSFNLRGRVPYQGQLESGQHYVITIKEEVERLQAELKKAESGATRAKICRRYIIREVRAEGRLDAVMGPAPSER